LQERGGKTGQRLAEAQLATIVALAKLLNPVMMIPVTHLERVQLFPVLWPIVCCGWEAYKEQKNCNFSEISLLCNVHIQ
jgi:hypothetical protein